MQPKVLEFLCCPDCRGEAFELTVYQSERNGKGQNILEGDIYCGSCGNWFPVINGIPRMLPAALRGRLVSFHRNFFERHPHLLPQGNEGEVADERVVKTLEGYSYQYVALNDPRREVERWRENFLSSVPVGPDFFSGKTGIDVGCGNGRHLYCAHELGAEMVGVDLSEGVEIAGANTAQCARCHVVQGDIYHLPFKQDLFDFAYSIGVLHHLPNPREGFRRILPTVKQGGSVLIWVYGLRDMRLWYRFSHMTWLRGIAPRLPRRGQYAVSAILASLLELGVWLPCRVVSYLPGGGAVVRRIPLGDACRRSFRSKVRSVFDRIQPPVTHYHTGEELEGWFREVGLTAVTVLNRDGRGWMVGGIKEGGRSCLRSGVAR